MQKLMVSCNYFISEICKDILLRSSKIFYDFLTTQKEKEFRLKRKAYDKLEEPKKINQIKTRTGKISLDSSMFEDEKKYTIFKSNTNNNISLLTKANKQTKMIIEDMRQLGNKMNDLASTFQQLANESKVLNDNTISTQTILSMKNLIKGWAYCLKKQAMSLELDFKQYFKYLKNEYKAIHELYVNFENNKRDYVNTRDKLFKKKEELFKKKDVNKWGLSADDAAIDCNNKNLCFEKMLPTETNNLLNLKKICCYYGNSFENEYNRLRYQIEDLNKKNIEKFYNKNAAILKELYEIWNKFTKFEEIPL